MSQCDSPPMDCTIKLLELPIWDVNSHPDNGRPSEQIRLSYERARSVVRHVGMTTRDIVTLSPKFRGFFSDFLGTADSVVATILSTHWNLCMGTIAAYAADDHADSYARRVLLELEEFRSVGEFMLAEVAHGLDARKLETTATYNHDGSFDLHTPSPTAAKCTPSTSPEAGVPRIAVVFAQLVVDGERRGTRPFIVRLCDADAMTSGLCSRPLPPLKGPKHVQHRVTMFNHVRLEPAALLGTLEAAKDLQGELSLQVHRQTVATLCLSMRLIPVLRVAAFMLGRCGERRQPAGPELTEKIPATSLTTRHGPVLVASTLSSVLEAYAAIAWGDFCRAEQPPLRDGLACIFKAAAAIDGQSILDEMAERCGWQGLCSLNQIADLASAVRGSSIAEGDYLALCSRLVLELLLGRCSIPKARNPTSLLARHEYGVWREAAGQAKAIMGTEGSNRNELLDAMILLRCRKLVQAVGHRMAYEAALESSTVTVEMLRLYEATCMLKDPGWYVENTKFTSSKLDEHHAMAVRALLPSLDKLLDESGAAAWVTSPILSEQRWTDFVGKLAEYNSGSGSSNAETMNGCVWDNNNHVTVSEPADGESRNLEGSLELDKLRASRRVPSFASRQCNCL
ncbi:Acyl-CoA dehydrogenase/oxidase [Metarhizium album ARSEF 1941]|uniref:Acyl-CoA dehydrogenase/oxidase n=1 Tax=Metarhizium album (strain ARSEF 1941) TaxID=1081103 RepID=A0A0B2X813_METAS|nr:Acyl-CoA dehydrogenase/oxidase [Metarhizium album ARSEF 1941]KHO01645.1 Acyl-CoA dehydrogenase/oxidase [Metarhizium album ARSEF 1941]